MMFHRLSAILATFLLCTAVRADQPVSASLLYSILEVEAQQNWSTIRSKSTKTPTSRAAVEASCCFPDALASARRKLSKSQASSIVANPRERAEKIMTEAARTCRQVGAESARKELIEFCSLSPAAMNSSDPAAYCKCYSTELSKLSSSTIADISEKMEAFLSKANLSESERAEIEKLYSPMRTSCQ